MKKRGIISLALTLSMASLVVISASAAAPQLTPVSPGGDTQVTARIEGTSPGEVSYIITIPEKVDFGTLTQPDSDETAHDKDIDFTVTAEEINNLPANNFVKVSVKDSQTTAEDERFRLNQVSGSTVLYYDVYDVNPIKENMSYPLNNTATMEANGFLLTLFSGTGQSLTGTLRIDQNQLFGQDLDTIAGDYSGTMAFYSEIINIKG